MGRTYDLVVIGAGPGGYMAALEAAKAGMKTVLVEKDKLGGTCLNRGCIPTKTMMHSSGLYRELKGGASVGITAENLAYDLTAIYQRKDDVAAGLRDGIASLMKKNKISVFEGSGQIFGEHLVIIDTPNGQEMLETSYILIATGSEPSVPPIPGAALPGVVTSDGLLDISVLESLDANKKRLVIIGGGVIGMEFASIFNALDYQVTVVEALDRILANMDREISQNTKMIYKKRGIDIHTASMVNKIERSDDGSLNCFYTEKEQAYQVVCDLVLVAIGRRPVTSGLFGEDICVHTEHGRILVNDAYQTNYPSIYAIGDVIGGIQLAHVATAEGICAVSHMAKALSGDAHIPEYDVSVVPSCVYLDPEIACAGKTSAEAKQEGIEIIVKKYPMSANGKSVLSGQERGFIKLVARADNHELIGAQLMCARATDMIGGMVEAIVSHLTLEQMERVIYPHPTYCEGIGEALRS